jgi:hypothetical protein
MIAKRWREQPLSSIYLIGTNLLNAKLLGILIKPSTGLKPSELWRASEDIPFGRIGVSLHLLHIHTIGGEKPHTSVPSPITL